MEFHGSGRTFSCLTCGASYPRATVRVLPVPPKCTQVVGGKACEAILKPDVVFFDEMIPPTAIAAAEQLVQGAELILVAGTSCEVFPAAEIPQQVRRQGGRIVEINLEPADQLRPDLSLIGSFSAVTSKLRELWLARRS